MNIKNLKQTYRENEENNLHAENCVLLADNFGTLADQAIAHLNLSTRDRQGYVDIGLSNEANERTRGYQKHLKTKYTEAQLKKMCNLLALRDIEQSDDSTLFDVFMEGCIGWENFDDDFVVEQFEMHFGGDYFEVIDQKDHKNGLYGDD